MTSLRVLLVDDEPLVTRGLERMLRRQLDWEISTAECGDAALQMLGENEFDVLLSDMRMPGMSGLELLAMVRDKWPGVGRVILSGQSQHDTTIQSADVAHRYLAKPCEPEVLRETVASFGRAQALVPSDELRAEGGRLPSLPILNTTREALGSLIAAEELDGDAIIGLAHRDPGLAARIMQLSSSAVFGTARVPRTLHEAVSTVRADTVRDLYDADRLCWSLDPEDEERAGLADIAMESGAAAMEHQLAAIESGHDDVRIEAAFTRGLLGLSGKLGFAAISPRRYAEASGHPDVLEAAFGAPYEAFGTYLLCMWGVSHECHLTGRESCPLAASA